MGCSEAFRQCFLIVLVLSWPPCNVGDPIETINMSRCCSLGMIHVHLCILAAEHGVCGACELLARAGEQWDQPNAALTVTLTPFSLSPALSLLIYGSKQCPGDWFPIGCLCSNCQRILYAQCSGQDSLLLERIFIIKWAKKPPEVNLSSQRKLKQLLHFVTVLSALGKLHDVMLLISHVCLEFQL